MSPVYRLAKKTRPAAGGRQDPVRKNGNITNSANMALRGSNQMMLSAAASKGWAYREIVFLSAPLKGNPMERKFRLTPPPEAVVGKGRARRCVKAIYGLADAPSEYYRALTGLLQRVDVWRRKVGATPSANRDRDCLLREKING